LARFDPATPSASDGGARRILDACREHTNKEEQEFLPAARRPPGAVDWTKEEA